MRGDPHLLLVGKDGLYSWQKPLQKLRGFRCAGDPGTGKSQFLRFACKLSQRSVLTTGGGKAQLKLCLAELNFVLGTTSAGLTCAAVKVRR